MTWSRKFGHFRVLYKQLQLLKLQDIYKSDLSKFVRQLNCDTTPKVFEKNFVKLQVCICMHIYYKTKN